MAYTGHKNKHMINGANIVDWVMCQIIQESKLYGGIPIPSREQVALVIRAMRMPHLLEYSSNYDFPKPQEADDIIKFFPAISSIGRFFRDAPLEVLDEYKMEQGESINDKSIK